MVFSMYNVTGNCIYGIFYICTTLQETSYFWYFLCTTLQQTSKLLIQFYDLFLFEHRGIRVSYCDQYVGCMPTIASKRCLL